MLKNDYPELIAHQLINVNTSQIIAAKKLFDAQATIPFIARYRKEATQNLDEQTLSSILQKLNYYDKLDKRKQYIIKTIDEQGKLTETLQKNILNETDDQKLEDLYLPYKPARKTRAAKAKNAGLEPLAMKIFQQQKQLSESAYRQYICDDYSTEDQVKQGVTDIIAALAATDPETRAKLRDHYQRKGSLRSKLKKSDTDPGKYKNYIDYAEPLSRVKRHRILAVLRGAKEEVLTVGIEVDEMEILHQLKKRFLKRNGTNQQIIIEAITDGYKRLLHPSLENETLKKIKADADKEAISLFADNLRQLLMAPPLGEKRILAIDPGFKTGCKVVCLDEQGNLLHNETIYPHPPQKDTKKAIKKIQSLSDAYKPEAIAIGNGTASKETEKFIRKIKFADDIEVYMVNEDGASVYSASKTARQEFPQYDVTVRGAVSIGRRLLDPLAELIKIDPKSIGVGQYQHDVDQKMLKDELDQTVCSCVNQVGVNLNTAGYHLLAYVSGLSTRLAENIVNYRKTNGKFNNRNELLKVPGMGPKSFEQSAGFLRIRNGANLLDNTGVHPESYKIVNELAKQKKQSVEELINNQVTLTTAEKKNLTSQGVGQYTLNDIIKELNQPGRDPRGQTAVFTFNQRIKTIEDLEEGMLVPAVVTNITDFGAFVDIGIKQNGLIHISEIADEYIAHPSEKLKINDQLIVSVKHIELERERIQLSLKDAKRNQK